MGTIAYTLHIDTDEIDMSVFSTEELLSEVIERGCSVFPFKDYSELIVALLTEVEKLSELGVSEEYRKALSELIYLKTAWKTLL